MERALGISTPKEDAVFESMSFSDKKSESVFSSYSRPSINLNEESVMKPAPNDKNKKTLQVLERKR